MRKSDPEITILIFDMCVISGAVAIIMWLDLESQQIIIFTLTVLHW